MIMANPDYRMWWREEIIRPNNNGSVTGIWSNSSFCAQVDLHLMVNETASDGDATYCVTDDDSIGGPTCGLLSGPGQQSFAMDDPADITPADYVLSVTPHALARKTSASSVCTFRSGVRHAGSDSMGSTSTLTTSYVEYSPTKFSAKPAGGNWDFASIKNCEGIIEAVSIGLGPQEERVTQFYLTVEYVVMPELPRPLLAGYRNRRLNQNRLVYMPPEFFIQKRCKKLAQTVAAPSPYFSDQSKRRRAHTEILYPPGGYNFARRQTKALPFGAPPPPSTAVFTQPRRIALNRRSLAIRIRRLG